MGNQVSPFIICTFVLTILLFVSCGDRVSDSHNFPPAVPSNPSPGNGASDQELDVQLSWESSDPNGDNLTFDLYFGTSANPPLIGSGLEQSTFDAGSLGYGTTYYWKVVANDARYQSESPLWSFTVRNQAGIQLIGSLELSQQYVRDLWVSNGYVYISCLSTLLIIDALDPSAPFVVSSINAEGGANIEEVYIRDNIVYVAAGNAGLQIYEMLNIFTPVLIGNSRWEEHNSAATIYVVDDYAYLADDNLGTVHIVDISDPANPTRISFSEELIHAGGAKDIFVYEGYAYVLTHSEAPPTYDRISIVDLTDITNPHSVALFETGRSSNGIYCFENHLFVPGSYSGDLQIFDISNPPDPVLATVYETPRRAVDIFI